MKTIRTSSAWRTAHPAQFQKPPRRATRTAPRVLQLPPTAAAVDATQLRTCQQLLERLRSKVGAQLLQQQGLALVSTLDIVTV